jgi:1-aminocyclopropane-1-carboxylate deaminase/D-cysteine desulfhydrase-like pyridoxal-dependent ACC family enzyme
VVAPLPLFVRFPALAELPRAELGVFKSPVERIRGLESDREIWIKRDDLLGNAIGGNKVRSLEFLLGPVRSGEHVLTVGSTGSTHALATALYSRQLGARTTVMTWRQEMNAEANAVANWMKDVAQVIPSRFTVFAFARAMLLRLREPVHWVPAGGSSPRGILGHVNAGLELASQIDRGIVPRPDRIVLPLGTGGTAAGVALGLAIAGVRTTIVMARVVPRIVANRVRVRSLMRRTAALIQAKTGERVSLPPLRSMDVVEDQFGGAYGRATDAGTSAARELARTHRVVADTTYSAKAFAATLALRGQGVTLFWQTFDGRWLAAGLRS